jgi:hypothetical protein
MESWDVTVGGQCLYVLLMKVPEHALQPMLQFKIQTAHQFCFVVWFS